MTRSAVRTLLLAIAASAGPWPGARDAAAAPPQLFASALQQTPPPLHQEPAPRPETPGAPQSAASGNEQEPLPVQDPAVDTLADPAITDTSATGLAPASTGPDEPAAIATVPWSDTGIVLEPWQLLAIYLLAMALIATVAVFAYSRFLASRRPALDDDPDGDWPLPPLVIPARLAPDGGNRPLADLSAPDPVPADTSRQPWANLTQSPRTGQASPRGRPVLHAAATAPLVAPEAPEQGEMVDAGPIRFHRPPDGTLQLLPGRLEILSGNERQEEIRFVRVAGQDAVVTFGRSEGEPHLHVQLRSRTVSRLHASIRFQEGRWYIANLSRTNPVVLNGQQMSGADAVHVALEDGDHIEMGEVVFRFRSR